jgi:hypothetical protein
LRTALAAILGSTTAGNEQNPAAQANSALRHAGL